MTISNGFVICKSQTHTSEGAHTRISILKEFPQASSSIPSEHGAPSETWSYEASSLLLVWQTTQVVCSSPRLVSGRLLPLQGGGPRVVVSTAAFHARVRGSVPGLGGLKETKMFLPHPRVKVSIVGSLRDREVACSASDRQGSNFESCVWRTVSSQSSHHPQEVLLAQFSLYVHKGGLKPDSFHFLPLHTGFCDCQDCGWVLEQRFNHVW